MDCELAEIIVTISSLMTALATVGLAFFGIQQIKSLKKQVKLQGDQIKIQGEREKKWHTVDACERYSTDPILHRVTKQIWENSSNGTDYTNCNSLDHNIIQLLDYLDSIAVGIEQDIYDEYIVKSNLEEVVYKAVKVFIKGESGCIHERSWIAGKSLCGEKEYPFLSKLYKKWFNE
jgi:hypothetical protein